MFAHYNQHYQHEGGTAVSTSGMVWNGNAWVAAGHGHVATSGHSTYSTSAYGAAGRQQQEASSLVTKYTQYYHQWTARAKEHEEHAQRLPLNSSQRSEAESHAQWSKYYADQASRAAHHYHSNPHTPAPFELPPAPPAGQQEAQAQQQVQAQQQPYSTTQRQSVSTPSSAKTKKASRWSAEGPSTSAASASKGSPSDGPPDALKRYVHRCLEQCKTPEQTKAVERETERVIAKALQNGNLHTTNWDKAPLIPIPGSKRNSSSSRGQPQSSKKQKLTTNDSYYGPSGGTNQSSFVNGDEGGHYGPSSSSPPNKNGTHTPPHNFTHSPYQQQQHSKYQQGHYGYNPMHDKQDFISVPQFGKNGKKSNKYVNPNSTKHSSSKAMADDGFQRSSATLAKRASRFSGPGGNDDVRQATAKGIDARYMGKGVIGGSSKQLDENDYEHMKVKGTCMKLEKQYLRLTAPPKPELVRPLEILQQHLKNLEDEWRSSNKRDYVWFCSEMKSMRQDLTVQHISNAFTVEAYEFHARIALQEGDLNEFNQAQTQLKILYRNLEDPKALENQNEFVAYLVIYFVMLSLNKKYTGGSSDLLNLMLSLTPDQKRDESIRHALRVRACVQDFDYHSFFRLYATCPNLGGKLMDLMVPTVRHWALQRICRVYRPTVEVVFVLKELGWNTEKTHDLDDGRKFLVSCGVVLNEKGTEINTKESVVRESDLQEKRSLI